LKLPAIAAVVTAASATAASAATTAAATAIVLTRAGFVNDHVAAVIFLTVELRDRCIRRIFVSHLYETKPSRTSGLTIVNDVCRFDSTGSRKMFLKIFTRYTKRQVSNVKFIAHFPFLFFSKKRKGRVKTENLWVS
jgi:hypothetical protein